MVRFSPSTGGFYDESVHLTWPADCVFITLERHRELLAAQGEGQMIVAGLDGAPVAVDLPISGEQAMGELRRERDARLAASDFSQLADVPLDDAARAAWRAYRQALRDLPQNSPDATAVTWPAIPA